MLINFYHSSIETPNTSKNLGMLIIPEGCVLIMFQFTRLHFEEELLDILALIFTILFQHKLEIYHVIKMQEIIT